MKEIFVLVTMDVEKALPANRPASTTGPRNYEESAVFIEAYVQRAKSHGFPVSFMIHPEVTHEHKALFNQLEEDGACLGLHLHPWKFLDGRYKAHFGGLTRDEQRDILGEAIEMWSDAMIRKPLWFRPGTFSANDNTMPLLAELGFRGGSISLPGRVYPDMCAVWAGAPPDPHFGHAAFRHLPGELDFVNIPLSVVPRGDAERESVPLGSPAGLAGCGLPRNCRQHRWPGCCARTRCPRGPHGHTQ